MHLQKVKRTNPSISLSLRPLFTESEFDSTFSVSMYQVYQDEWYTCTNTSIARGQNTCPLYTHHTFVGVYCLERWKL